MKRQTIILYAPVAVCVLFLVIGIVGLFIVQGELSARKTAQIQVCERVKQDRVDNARGWTKMEKYLSRISVQATTPEIQKTAQDARVLVGETANQLRTRILQCRPLIENGDFILDERLHKEALGDL